VTFCLVPAYTMVWRGTHLVPLSAVEVCARSWNPTGLQPRWAFAIISNWLFHPEGKLFIPVYLFVTHADDHGDFTS
jgi:hypothetical protein